MKRKLSLLFAGLLCLSLCLGAEAAGTVTDTLTVRVGYYGMEQDRYVEVATYHWSELYDALPLHYEAYSFFRSTDDGTYNTVIDSAYGFYLADLLDYAGIYSGDISVVAFYTRDQSVGFFTSFTYADLFGTQRYYYNDLSAHISPVYDENGTLTGYDGDEAWNDCWTVQPMLALEDSWVSYEIGTEHTAPNYSSLGTGNRFRLLFGQSYPLECRTNQSAKYTHTLFITLQGTPKITEEPPELDGTLGSHTATFQISVGQQALRDALAQYLDIASSDSSVLEITGITVTPDAQYSDLATVTVHYTVHAEGEVELSFGFGGTSIAENRQVTAKQPEEKPTEPTKPAETTPSTEPSEGPGGGPSAPTGGAEPRETTPSTASLSEAAPAEPAPTEPTAAVDPDTIRMYALPDALAAQLQSGGQAEAPGAADPVPVTVVTVQPEDDRRLLLLTGAGALALAVLGALCALRYYTRGRRSS